MKTEHTQGPWEVHYSLANKNLASVTARNREPIAPCVGKNAEANARLIAAAPELLEALYAALPCVEESEEFDKPHGPKLSVTIRALLAQVEGNA